MKSVRQRRILQMIRDQAVTSQNQLVKSLRSMGIPATQATVSRDLDEIGAVKVRKQGKVVYALPAVEASLPMGDALQRILSESVVSLESTTNILVLKTPPGHAHMVAAALDRGPVEGVAGTVAGDDTVLVVCKQSVLARRVERRLRSIIDSIPGVAAPRV